MEKAREEWKKTKDLRQPSVLPPDEDETRNHNDESNDEPNDEQDEDELSEDDIGGRLVIPAADNSGGLVIPAAPGDSETAIKTFHSLSW